MFIDIDMNIIEYLRYMHIVERKVRNRDEEAPGFKEMVGMIQGLGSGWYLAPFYFNIFHDNGMCLPELKFVNLDGREYIYTADGTGDYSLEIDEDYRGSYNFSPPIYSGDVFEFIKRCILHTILDVIPYVISL